MKPVVWMAGLVAALLAATALPFLPGRYDGLALGAAAMALDRSGAILTLCVAATWGLVLRRGGRRLLSRARQPRGRDIAAAVALIVVPAVTVGGQMALSGPLAAIAWNRTIDAMEPLIADIERYRAANGHYPRSLFSQWHDYRHSIMGVSRYQYEPYEDAYSLAVEVPSFTIDSQEFLHYNPSGIHPMVGHDAILLQLAPAEQAHNPGYAHSRQLDRPGWALLSFD